MKNINRFKFSAGIFKKERVPTLLILMIISFMFAAAYWNILLPRKDFYNELWSPAFLLVHGQSPYQTDGLDAELPAAWLPMSIGFFSPLGLLEENIARGVWYFFNILVLCGIILLTLGRDQKPYDVIILALFSFLFPMTLAHLILGQFSLVTTLCAMIAVVLIVNNFHWAGAALLALGLSKPQLLTLVGIGLCYRYLQEGGYGSVLKFGLRVSSAIFLLCLPLFVAYPNWIPDALEGYKKTPYWSYPKMYTVLPSFLGKAGFGLWLVLVIFVVWGTIRLWKNFEPIFAAYWSLALALLVTPYAGPWDFVVLLPVFLYAFSIADRKRKVLAGFLYFVIWCCALYVQYSEGSISFSFWWIPPLMMIFTALAIDWKAELEKGGRPPLSV